MWHLWFLMQMEVEQFHSKNFSIFWNKLTEEPSNIKQDLTNNQCPWQTIIHSKCKLATICNNLPGLNNHNNNNNIICTSNQPRCSPSSHNIKWTNLCTHKCQCSSHQCNKVDSILLNNSSRWWIWISQFLCRCHSTIRLPCSHKLYISNSNNSISHHNSRCTHLCQCKEDTKLITWTTL